MLKLVHRPKGKNRRSPSVLDFILEHCCSKMTEKINLQGEKADLSFKFQKYLFIISWPFALGPSGGIIMGM